MRILERLLNFIQASRSRNWLLHIKSAKEIMLDFFSMNRMKHRRMWPGPDVWAVFMRVDFSYQKFNIPGTAIGRDHAGEQENKIIKNRGDITGILRNKNSRTRHSLAAPTLSSILKEMMEIGRTNISKAFSRHHQLSPSYNKRQNEKIYALLNMIDGYLSFNSETVQLQTIITGQLYSKEIFESLVIHCTQKMKFSIKYFFSKCDQIRSFLRIWSHLPKKSLIETSFLCSDS